MQIKDHVLNHFEILDSSNYRLNELHEIEEDYLYDGSENAMRLERYYNIRLHCDYKLRAYPFDTQNCPVELEIPARLQPQMSLILHKVTHGKLTSVQYNFVDLKGQILDDENLLVLDILMKR